MFTSDDMGRCMFSILCGLYGVQGYNPPVMEIQMKKMRGEMDATTVCRATLEYIGHGAGFCALAIAEKSNSSTEQALRQPRDSQSQHLNL